MQPWTDTATDPQSKELRCWRERRAAATRARDLGTADVAEREARIASSELRTRAPRPWATRTQAAAGMRKAAESRLAAAERDLAAARTAALRFNGQVAKARAAAAAAEADLASVRTEGSSCAAAGHRAAVAPDVPVAALRATADAAGNTLEALLAALLADTVGSAEAMSSASGMPLSDDGQHCTVAAEVAQRKCGFARSRRDL